MILSGIVTPVCLSHDHDLLAEFARILKPSGLLIIREPTVEQGTSVARVNSDCTIRIQQVLSLV